MFVMAEPAFQTLSSSMPTENYSNQRHGGPLTIQIPWNEISATDSEFQHAEALAEDKGSPERAGEEAAHFQLEKTLILQCGICVKQLAAHVR